jgi:hypothetical protein
VLQKALSFAEQGYNVFPVNKKLPILKGWPDKATTDRDIIIAWYEGFASSADGFGVCPKDNCVVIDVDVKGGKNGSASLKTLIDDYNLPKNTQIIRTTSGGLHLYYKYPALLEGQHIKSVTNWNVNGIELDGIDIRGNRGQVVGPCGLNGYTSINEMHVSELADLPQSLVTALPVDKAGGLKKELTIDVNSGSALVVYDTPAIGGKIPDVIPNGERHQTLLSLTASWARKQPYETAKVLLKEAIARCEGHVEYDDYLERLDDAYSKFEPVVKDKVQWMLDHLVYIAVNNSVYRLDKPGNIAVLDMTSATSFYKNWIVWEEVTLASGETKSKPKPAFPAWMSNPDRKSVQAVGYKPVIDPFYFDPIMGAEVINCYKPGGLVGKEGDVQWFTDLVEFLWADEAYLILDLCAHFIQHPTKKVHWAPLLITEQEGMGKNVFFNIISQCIGQWNSTIVNASMFIKSFNTFLVQNQLVLVNEVQDINKSDRQSMVSKLKSYITESAQSIEGKGANVYTTEIYSNFFIFSNKIDAIDVESSSRRFHVHINRDNPKPDQWYNEIVQNSEKPDALNNLIYFLQKRDLSSFNHTGHAPVTEAKLEVVKSNKSGYELEIDQHIELEYSIFASDIVTDESWHYYMNEVLHKGGKMSIAQEKYLQKQLLSRVTTINSSGNHISRQIVLPTINPLSDNTAIIKGTTTRKMLCFCVRNHEHYIPDEHNSVDLNVIKAEYEKLFLKPVAALKAI